ncbi:MAG: zinc ribbon domain-containing protein [Planctomycetota bacterium]
MPTYDYRCNGCGHEFELFQSMKDKPKRKCPECGQLKLERLIGTGGAVIFKGGGFYETDYRSESYKKGAEKDKKATESKGESKSDSKTETKAKSDSKDTAKKPKPDKAKAKNSA